MTQELNFLINYFNQFTEEELQSHGKLYLSDITNILGYATFDDSDIGHISDVTSLRDEIANRFYN